MGDSEPQTQLESLRLGVVIPGGPRSLQMLRNFTERTIETVLRRVAKISLEAFARLCMVYVRGVATPIRRSSFSWRPRKCDMRVRIGCLGA